MNWNLESLANGWFGRLIEKCVLGAVLVLVLIITMPGVLDDNRKALLEVQKAQAKQFVSAMQEIASTNLKTAEIHRAMVQSTMEQIRIDEREDRRLFVEILRRSDLNSEELQAAIEAASSGGDGT